MQTTKRILLTGGTGFIGSHIAAKLIQLGYKIYFLTRSNGKFHAEDRILRAVSPLTTLPRDQYKVLEGDLSSPLKFDIPEPIDEIWNCAGALSFKEEDRLETFATNVMCVEHLLEFTDRNSIKCMQHVSTRYVHGKRNGLIKEDELNCGQTFFNPYEESKMAAEELISKWSSDTGGKAFVYRPSVVVGNSKTGFTSSFSGYYTCARGFVVLKKLIESEFSKGVTGIYSGDGIAVKNGILHLPICFPALPDTPIDILPVDIVVKAITDIAQKDISGVFHITNANLVSCRQFMEMSMDILGIEGVQLKPLADKNVSPVIQRLNEQIDQTAQYYKPYTLYGADGPVCDQTNTRAVLGRSISYNISRKFLETVLGYALRVSFRG